MSLVLAKKVGYKLRENKFRFAMGSEVKNPYLRQAAMVDDSCTERYSRHHNRFLLHIHQLNCFSNSEKGQCM